MKRVTILLLLAGMPLLTRAANTQLELLKKKWEESLGGLVLEHAERVKQLGMQYAQALTGLKQAFQEQGDLDKVQAVLKEADRFAREKAIPHKVPETVLPEIAKVRSVYRQHVAESESAKARGVSGLAKTSPSSSRPPKASGSTASSLTGCAPPWIVSSPSGQH